MCVPLCYDNLYTLKQVIESSEVHHFLIPNLPLSSSSTSSLPTGSSSSFPLASCYVHHNKPTLISSMAKIPYNKPAVRVVSCQNTKYNMYLDPVLGTVLTILTIVLLVSGFQEHYFLFYWFFVCFFFCISSGGLFETSVGGSHFLVINEDFIDRIFKVT